MFIILTIYFNKQSDFSIEQRVFNLRREPKFSCNWGGPLQLSYWFLLRRSLEVD